VAQPSCVYGRSGSGYPAARHFARRRGRVVCLLVRLTFHTLPIPSPGPAALDQSGSQTGPPP